MRKTAVLVCLGVCLLGVWNLGAAPEDKASSLEAYHCGSQLVPEFSRIIHTLAPQSVVNTNIPEGTVHVVSSAERHKTFAAVLKLLVQRGKAPERPDLAPGPNLLRQRVSSLETRVTKLERKTSLRVVPLHEPR